MAMNIGRRVAVLGAGTMGGQIAALFASTGVPVLLLDVDEATARAGLERARAIKPDAFFTPDALRLVTTGGFDRDLGRLADCDWIIEAVTEQLDIKRELLARVDAERPPAAIVSTNTSGIPMAALAEGRSSAFRRSFLGTHFFNPPRYLQLLEIIPAPDTDPAVLNAVSAHADRRLGKGVVICRDTPNFIANRIALYAVARALDLVAAGRFTLEEIDAATGAPLGRPRSATFRTADLAGLDVLVHVASNLSERLETEDERRAFTLPAFVGEMVRRGWTGDKAGRGFYHKLPAEGPGAILALDPASLEYRPRQTVKLAALDRAASLEDTPARIRTLFVGRDRAGELLRETLGATLLYAARVAPEIAQSIDDVDRAMRWGYGWELGPFETWDAIGIRQVLDACGVADPPPLVRTQLEDGRNAFRDGPAPPAGPDLLLLTTARRERRIVRENPGASLVDLGDGVLAVELHSKLNIIGGDTLQMLGAGLREAARNFAALVVATSAADFSAGANLMLLHLAAQEEEWDEIDGMVRTFQATTQALRHSVVPVVIAVAGRALGGGCELALHGERVQAAAETYIGLVETGVGLIPAGGGTKELLARSLDASPAGGGDLLPAVRRAFETIAYARVSTSGPDARRLGYLRDVDEITMNRERLVADAKTRALARAAEGYRPPLERTRIPVGGESTEAALKLGIHLAWRAGRISDHDALIGRKLASVMSGGSLPHPTTVGERYLLDLEREAFLSLCGERKTLERIAHTLRTGKPLRN